MEGLAAQPAIKLAEYEPFQPPVHEGIHGAAEFIDRDAIEAEARGLIEQRGLRPTIEVRNQERQDNARTALMEALTASGHLSVVEIHGSLEEINAQVLSRLLNGWDDSLPGHEQQRRFAELCNELVIQRVHGAIVAGHLPPDTEVAEISDYPEALRGTQLGYRDSNKKGMVRSTGLHYNGDGHYTRRIEQVSRSNGTQQSTVGFFTACGQDLGNKPHDIAGLEAPQVYSRHDYAEGVISLMRILDRYTGTDVLYGDRGNRASKHPAYENIRAESARREEEVACYVDDLAALEHQLDEWVGAGVMTRTERLRNFKDEVQRILDAICTLEPNYAEDTFGVHSVAMFEEVALLTSQGRHTEAAKVLESKNYLKETVTFCGVTISIDEAKAKGMKVNGLGDLVETGKKNWKWKQGTCVVKSCVTRPGKTEVGPCSVCRKCQAAFDKGHDPTKFTAPKKQLSNNTKSKVSQ